MLNKKIIGGLLGSMTLLAAQAQDGVGNHGAMQLHAGGAAGFHTDFQNHGAFTSPESLVGFYRENASLVISGEHAPEVFDAEFDAPAGIWLETPMEIRNNANLIRGDVRTTRFRAEAYPMFGLASFYTGESNVSKIDGYASIRDKTEFTFPIGDNSRLRPLRIQADAPVPVASAAYFFEAPQASGTLGMSFVSKGGNGNLKISANEFWRVEAAVPLRVTLSWDVLSNAPGLAGFLGDLRVVGWDKSQEAWVDLGNTDVQGGRDYGTITSDTFLPDRYEIITLGGTDGSGAQYRTVDLNNYYLSPNGDGKNETLELEATREAPNNTIEIYNRYGQLVYRENQYQGGFDGHANTDFTVGRGKSLPDGIYFYIITLHERMERHQGYLYLNP
ncbi:gliding motility-associated C-terminal domain-containing protein [Robiginitalea sp. M366]|uniref:gliding motility-associated C-terminal domain-containing protein n=1 Tax=Robiginitalea aestuariiviva TaxID=3036903 RepID=UPI00240D183A|nr:gliding motility-associated C-terminal domain-containing protein [Robiginitalea aestuariiviva]MDG1570797.1 gliding motility-associated C-terminal domain-containing protein [Robiginitalea aestuariiviva]